EVTSSSRSRLDTSATSSTARSNASSFAREGFVNPLILRTYWSAAARTSSSVAGGSKLKSVWMFRHMLTSYGAALTLRELRKILPLVLPLGSSDGCHGSDL